MSNELIRKSELLEKLNDLYELNWTNDDYVRELTNDDINARAFLTREEAEKALEGLNND